MESSIGRVSRLRLLIYHVLHTLMMWPTLTGMAVWWRWLASLIPCLPSGEGPAPCDSLSWAVTDLFQIYPACFVLISIWTAIQHDIWLERLSWCFSESTAAFHHRSVTNCYLIHCRVSRTVEHLSCKIRGCTTARKIVTLFPLPTVAASMLVMHQTQTLRDPFVMYPPPWQNHLFSNRAMRCTGSKINQQTAGWI